MAKLKIYDGFETKKDALAQARDLKKQGVQYVRVKRMGKGRLKWGVYLGGKNSGMYV